MTEAVIGSISNRIRRRPRRPIAAVGLAALLLTTGCSGGDDAPSAIEPLVSTSDSTPSSTAGSTGSVTVAPATAAASTVPIDGAGLLQQGLDAVAGGYHFDTSVTIDGAEIAVVAGDRVGDGTRLTIWAQGGSVAYVITPTASWAFPEGGEWEALDTPPSTTDPIVALRSPISITPITSDATAITLAVTVPATSIGVPGEGDATLNVVVNAGVLGRITYDTTVDGRPAAVSSVLSPVVDATPVVPPI